MALTHHLIVLYSAFRAGIETPRYAILGDDCLIHTKQLYDSYCTTISELDMILNDDKTFKSRTLVEFAKRFHHGFDEITPFPIGAVEKSKGNEALLMVALDDAFAKS
jgi:hypothetical protein